MKKRILIISTFFPPLNSIASHRPYSWAKYWHKLGHDVTVLTTTKFGDSCNLSVPNPGFKVIEVPINTKLSHLKQNLNAKKSWLASLIAKIRNKTGILSACRMPDHTHLWVKPALSKILQEGMWDLVVSTSGPYPVHLIAKRLKKAGLAKRWIADFRDLWTDNHIFKGLFPFTLIEKYLEKSVGHSADILTTVSPPLAKTLSSKYGSKVHTIENGFDPEQYLSLSKDKIFPHDGKVRLVYTGVVYQGKQNIEPLFEAIRALNDDKFEVIICGPKQEFIQTLVEKSQVNRWVKLQGLVDIQTSLRMQRDADYLIFLPWTDPSSDGIYSGKIFEYLHSGTPILAIGCKKNESAQQLIIAAHAGYSLKTCEEICSFLKKENRTKTQVDEDFLNQYNRQNLAARLLDL